MDTEKQFVDELKVEFEATVEDVESVDEMQDATETKAERFNRVAGGKVNKVLKAIGELEKVNSRTSYDYTPEQIDKAFDSIEVALATAKLRFAEKKPFSF